MDKSLENHKLPNLTQEEGDHPISTLSVKECSFHNTFYLQLEIFIN